MTAVYGIVGWPVGHSRSPAMHGAAFAAAGIDAAYVPFPVRPERLPEAVGGLRALGVAGANVTLPHKEAIIPLLDAVEPAAAAIGAVNTIVREGERLIGTNTDAPGLVRALREAGFEPAGRRVVVLGGGGAARAAVSGLASAGATDVRVAARRHEQAAALVEAMAGTVGSATLLGGDLDARWLREAFAGADLVVQATSATLAGPEEAEAFARSLPLDALPPTAVVTDLVYAPRDTAVLRAARARGLEAVDGVGMLLYQGVLAFERWTGRPGPVEAMRAALG